MAATVARALRVLGLEGLACLLTAQECLWTNQLLLIQAMNSRRLALPLPSFLACQT